MGFDLYHKEYDDPSYSDETDYHRYNIAGWPCVIAAALAYGWEPKGTVLKGKRPWVRFDRSPLADYFFNDGQTVEADDAAALADALERGLADGFRKEPRSVWMAEADEYDNSAYTEKFIRFCRAGEFKIW